MGNTIHEEAIEEAVDRLSAETLKVLMDYRAAIKRGEFPSLIVDSFCQSHFSNRLSLENLYCFACMYEMLDRGEIGACTIKIGSGPWADKDVAANQRALDRIAKPFKARFESTHGGGACGDGFVQWDVPLQVTTFDTPDGPPKHVEVAPWSAVLEAGSCHGSRVLLYLLGIDGQAVVRWPYGHDHAFLMTRLYPPNHGTW